MIKTTQGESRRKRCGRQYTKMKKHSNRFGKRPIIEALPKEKKNEWELICQNINQQESQRCMFH